MIQTQLLRLDPPYQIISAGGQVGIQLATLIVTEEKSSKPGEYIIDTHSHPVVCYGLKEGLVEEFKYGGGHPNEIQDRNDRLQPEGAVWNKVEVSDIRVLGLVGANNHPVSLDTFIYLVPSSSSYMPYSRVWDENSLAKMFGLIMGFSRVGLRCRKMKWEKDDSYSEQYRQMCLELDTRDRSTPLVHVILKGQSEYDPYSMEIGFYCRLYDANGSIDSCVNIIVHAVRELEIHFIDGRIGEKFTFWRSDQDQESDDDMNQLKDRINKELDL